MTVASAFDSIKCFVQFFFPTGGSIINYADYYQGLWDCTSDKSDELSFQRGDIIRILSKVKYSRVDRDIA